MNLKQLLSAALIAGALLTGPGGAQASGEPERPTNPATDAVHARQLTPAEQEVHKQLGDLRRAHRERYKADARALVDKAVKDGKLTREQGDRLLAHKHKGKWRHMSREELQTKLDERVQSGKITRERADEIMKEWEQHHAKAR
jgi:polyhydroxyalkanoate synthesis regulator phasin